MDELRKDIKKRKIDFEIKKVKEHEQVEK